MDIRPVDIQLMMNKASEVNKVSDTVSSQQQMFSAHLEEKTRQETQRTVNTSKSEGETITDKQQSNKREYKGKKSKRHKKENDSADKKKAANTSLFDVKI